MKIALHRSDWNYLSQILWRDMMHTGRLAKVAVAVIVVGMVGETNLAWGDSNWNPTRRWDSNGKR